MPRSRSRSPERRRSYSERDRDERRRHDDRDDSERSKERRRDKGKRESDRYRDRDRDRDRDRSRRERDGHRDKDGGRDRHRDRERRDRGDRDRDRDRDREWDRPRRERSASSSSDDLFDLDELGVSPISEDDYFLKASEFRWWLKTERGKYLDQLTSADAHKYFRRFVRRWNDGALPRACYGDHESTAERARANTAYKWEFAGHRSRVSSAELAAVRADVDRRTHAQRFGSDSEGGGAEVKAVPDTNPTSRATNSAGLDSGVNSDSDEEIGPLPTTATVGPAPPTSAADRQLAREAAAEAAAAERRAGRRAERKAVYERAEEVAPRERGREGKMAERRAANEANRAMREKDTEVELDEETLLGNDGGFAAALRARDAAAARRADKRSEDAADRRAAMEERLAERREKEAATMDMLRTMAKQRFGGQ